MLPANDNEKNYRKIIVVGKSGCPICENFEKQAKKMGFRNRFKVIKQGSKYKKIKRKYDIHSYPTVLDTKTGEKNIGFVGKNGMIDVINRFSVKKRRYGRKKSNKNYKKSKER